MKSQNIRSAVYRHGAQTYILVSLISFAGTVMLTRLFLEITGYPQLGGGSLHIAHVLWGGLILFVAALLPLLFGNRWALDASALLSGIGIGLFIDEVGKFITINNDYFYPPAAPIIYAFFLLTVMVYLRSRKSQPNNTRAQLYQVLEGLTEILDHDLETNEREELIKRLENVKEDSSNPNLVELAQTLLKFVKAETLSVHDPRMTIVNRLRKVMRELEGTYLTGTRLRIALMIALLLVGVFAWYEVAAILPGLASHGKFVESVLIVGMQRGEIRSIVGAIWFFIHIGMQAIVGSLAFISSTFMALRKDKQAVDFGSACMVLSLTAVNLLSFYIDQFSTSIVAIFQLLILIGLAIYRRRFITNNVLS